jgi:hypothetical protein
MNLDGGDAIRSRRPPGPSLLNGFHLSHLLLLDVRADPGKPGQERSSGGGAGWVCGDGRVPRGVEVAPEPEAVRVSSLGEIDLATVDGVRQRRLDELRATGVRRLVLALPLVGRASEDGARCL